LTAESTLTYGVSRECSQPRCLALCVIWFV